MADEANSDSSLGFKSAASDLSHSLSALNDREEEEEALLLSLSATPKPEDHQEAPAGDLGGCQELGKKPAIMPLRNQPRRSLEIRVVDETALIGAVFSVPNPKRPRKARALAKKRVSEAKSGTGKRIVYSRERLEALRFRDVAEQRRMWRDVHVGLGPTVRKEYDFLLVRDHPRFDPSRRFSAANDRSPSVFLGTSAVRGPLNEVRVSAN